MQLFSSTLFIQPLLQSRHGLQGHSSLYPNLFSFYKDLEREQNNFCWGCKSSKLTWFISNGRKRVILENVGGDVMSLCMEAIHCKYFSRWTEKTLLYDLLHYLGETVVTKRPPTPSSECSHTSDICSWVQTCPQGGAELSLRSLFQAFSNVKGGWFKGSNSSPTCWT